MHLSFISLSHCIEILYNRYYASNVTEPESDAGMSSHRFTDYDGQSVVFGTIITQFLEVFFLQIWRHFRFWHLFDARKVSRKFGMTHNRLFFRRGKMICASSPLRFAQRSYPPSGKSNRVRGSRRRAELWAKQRRRRCFAQQMKKGTKGRYQYSGFRGLP